MWLVALQAAVIALQCTGVANVPERATTTVHATDGLNTASGSATTTSRSRASAIVDVEIEGDSVRLRLPESMSPMLGGRGDNGWRTPRTCPSISAKFRAALHTTGSIDLASGSIA